MQIDSSLEFHLPNLENFWLCSLNGRQRKQLLCPLKDSLTGILCRFWRTDCLEGIRLNHIFQRLFNFLLSSSGKGMWTAFSPKE